jgi:hypothetical protein
MIASESKSWFLRHRGRIGVVVALYLALLATLFITRTQNEWANMTTTYFIIANLFVLWVVRRHNQAVARRNPGASKDKPGSAQRNDTRQPNRS